MTTEIQLNYGETIISFDGNGLTFHEGFYDPDISKFFEVNLFSMTGTMEIVFKEVAIARINEKKAVLLRGIYAPDVFNALKVFKDGVYINEPWIIVGVEEDGSNHFLCKQNEYCAAWDCDVEHESVTLFSQKDAEIELQRQKEADMDWFKSLSAHPVSQFQVS
jgi:hypothetical protein